jgi:hypothetical protein
MRDFEQKALTSSGVGSATSGVLMIDRQPGIVPMARKKLSHVPAKKRLPSVATLLWVIPPVLTAHFGLPVRAGESRQEVKEASTIGIGTLAGQEVVRIVVTPKPTTYNSVAGAINFPGQLETTHEIVVLQMPYIAEICDADPVSIDVRAPAGPLNKLKSVKIVGAFAFKNFTFAFPSPASANQVKAHVPRLQ